MWLTVAANSAIATTVQKIFEGKPFLPKLKPG
jgi:hypothetical protein